MEYIPASCHSESSTNRHKTYIYGDINLSTGVQVNM